MLCCELLRFDLLDSVLCMQQVQPTVLVPLGVVFNALGISLLKALSCQTTGEQKKKTLLRNLLNINLKTLRKHEALPWPSRSPEILEKALLWSSTRAQSGFGLY